MADRGDVGSISSNADSEFETDLCRPDFGSDGNKVGRFCIVGGIVPMSAHRHSSSLFRLASPRICIVASLVPCRFISQCTLPWTCARTAALICRTQPSFFAFLNSNQTLLLAAPLCLIHLSSLTLGPQHTSQHRPLASHIRVDIFHSNSEQQHLP